MRAFGINICLKDDGEGDDDEGADEDENNDEETRQWAKGTIAWFTM
jgi:hypothetical protein